ncbi:hypothetical protein E2C01_093372 [Portunus trituberculatus]|uniref:Uncharacterized protein n=1 Tax=Portunus trituberculatus TaxID=210409 RepID=A0A5B7JPM1_PORTR|nr:hypothetical protein [Portunus trituberculatus]
MDELRDVEHRPPSSSSNSSSSSSSGTQEWRPWWYPSVGRGSRWMGEGCPSPISPRPTTLVRGVARFSET